MARQRSRRSRPTGLSPAGWLRRRRLSLTAIILLVLAVAVIDRLRPREPSPDNEAAPAGTQVQRDFARYDGQTFRVTHVVDGDTLYIDLPDDGRNHTKVRLWGVDTPEVHNVDEPMHFGPEASAFTKRLTLNQKVRIELVRRDTRDRYNRLLAYVWLPDGTMLNRRLVAEGYAYASPAFPHPRLDEFIQLERQARQAKVGLWRNITPRKMPAWRRKLEQAADAARSPDLLLHWNIPFPLALTEQVRHASGPAMSVPEMPRIIRLQAGPAGQAGRLDPLPSARTCRDRRLASAI